MPINLPPFAPILETFFTLAEPLPPLTILSMREKSFATGETIFLEGEEGREAFRILEGRIEISIHVGGQGDVPLGHLVPGDIFGEMALLDDKPRSATARALEPTRLHLMNIEEFNDLFLSDPSSLSPFLSSFFERLRNTNDLLRRELEQRQVSPSQMTRLIEQSGLGLSHEATHPIPKITLLAARPEMHKAGIPGTLAIDRLPFRIGRRQASEGADILSANDLTLVDKYPFQISRNHCSIERAGTELVVRDRGSTLGTLVNGKGIGTEAEHMFLPLKLGENHLTLGDETSLFQFTIRVDPPA